jgi:hypothetical protein
MFMESRQHTHACLNFSAPLIPSDPPFTPRTTSVASSTNGALVLTSTLVSTFCGVFIPAVKEICPGWSAVSRTTMTWSTGLEKTSRLNVTPLAV